MVIVDTSIWVAYLRKGVWPAASAVDDLLDKDEALVVGPVMFELLRGSRSPAEYSSLSNRLNELPFADTTLEVWTHAARLTYDLRSSGITVGMPDAVIAAIALLGHHQVFSLDRDFQRIPGLRLFNPSETSA